MLILEEKSFFINLKMDNYSKFIKFKLYFFQKPFYTGIKLKKDSIEINQFDKYTICFKHGFSF